MVPLKKCDKASLTNIRFVLCDMDDTLTFEGKLPAKAYSALEELKSNGIQVIVVTGRPAGWCDLIARLWPVSAVVGENGAFYFAYDQNNRTMVRKYQRDDEQREQDRIKLYRHLSDLQEAHPQITLSADQPYRISDIAIDFCEDVPAWSDEEVQNISQELANKGVTVKISSIHINAWMGNFSKLEMAQALLSDRMNLTEQDMLTSCIYVGDSPNDEPMFAYFPYSVGVANVRQYEETMNHLPRWITEEPGGYGFSELADLLLNS